MQAAPGNALGAGGCCCLCAQGGQSLFLCGLPGPLARGRAISTVISSRLLCAFCATHVVGAPSQITHGAWPLSAPGPVRDRITLGDNPQYRLAVTVPASPAGSTSAVWAVLTRHVTEKEEDDEDEEGGRKPDGGDDAASDRKDYLALHVFKGKGDAAGQRCVCVASVRVICYRWHVAVVGPVSAAACAQRTHAAMPHTRCLLCLCKL